MFHVIRKEHSPNEFDDGALSSALERPLFFFRFFVRNFHDSECKWATAARGGAETFLSLRERQSGARADKSKSISKVSVDAKHRFNARLSWNYAR